MNLNSGSRVLLVIASIALCLMSGGAAAEETRIAILDFELKDLTLAPGIPEEIERTASVRPLLEAELKKAGYVIINIDPDSRNSADAGVGYLYDHTDAAAKLGRRFDADYILVGRLHKPSFLFAYLMGRLIRIDDARLMGDFVSEAKGPSRKITAKAVESLAVKIDKALDNRYSPTAKSKQP
ncbi:MAG: DUF2380 domain-containing protein [Gammaproteobacteria bacterium]